MPRFALLQLIFVVIAFGTAGDPPTVDVLGVPIPKKCTPSPADPDRYLCRDKYETVLEAVQDWAALKRSIESFPAVTTANAQAVHFRSGDPGTAWAWFNVGVIDGRAYVYFYRRRR